MWTRKRYRSLNSKTATTPSNKEAATSPPKKEITKEAEQTKTRKRNRFGKSQSPTVPQQNEPPSTPKAEITIQLRRAPAFVPEERLGDTNSCKRANIQHLEYLKAQASEKMNRYKKKRQAQKQNKSEVLVELTLRDGDGPFVESDLKAENHFFQYDAIAHEKHPEMEKPNERETNDPPEDQYILYNERTLAIPVTDQGVIVKDEDGRIICIIPPRSMSLRLLNQKSAANQAHLFKWFLKKIRGIKRGTKTHQSISSHSYIVVGVKAKRGGVSTTFLGRTKEVIEEEKKNGAPNNKDEHPVFSDLPDKPVPFNPRKSLLRVAHRCEQIVQELVPSEELFALQHSLKSIDCPVHETFAGIWGSAAMGTNFCAAMHQDLDSFFSMLVVSSCLKDEDLPFAERVRHNTLYNAPVCHHFVFPTYGLAIPLRPGDHLLFNPLIFHGCSSKLKEYEDSDISLLAFYLKLATISGNDGDKIGLTKLEAALYEEYKMYRNSCNN